MTARKSKRGTRKPGAWIPWMLLAPSLAGVSLFTLLPFLDAVRRSFFSAVSGVPAGLRNYRAVLKNPAFQRAALNTLRFAVTCIPALIVLSLLLAVLLTACHEKRGVLKTTFLIPMAIPVSSIVLLWTVLFHRNGLLSALAVRMGAQPQDWMATGWAFAVLVGSYLWKNTGYDTVLWLSGLSGISGSLYEAAQVDGAGPAQRFFYITFPCLRPTAYTVSALSLLNSFKAFREAYLAAGEYPHPDIYLLQHLFNHWFVTLDVDKMCAAAVLTALAVFLAIGALRLLFGGEETL